MSLVTYVETERYPDHTQMRTGEVEVQLHVEGKGGVWSLVIIIASSFSSSHLRAHLHPPAQQSPRG